MDTHNDNTHESIKDAPVPSPYGPQPSPYGTDPTESPYGVATAMWETRPVRIPSDQGSNAMIAGVCEGIGARYQIDPTLVRVGFVVGTIAGGAGIPAYLAMWGLMPKYSKTTSPFEEAFGAGSGGADSGEAGTGWALASIGGLMLLSGIAASSGTLLITAAVLTGALYLLHKRKPLPPAGLLAQPKAVSDDVVDMSMFQPVEGYDVPPGRSTPPAWDPLGAAPDLWTLNEPAPVPASKDTRVEKKKNRRAIIGSLAAAGALTAVSVGAVILFGATVNSDGGIVGSTDVAPASVGALDNDINTAVGSHDIDLTQIADFDSMDGSRTIDVETGIGSINVTVPEDAPVSFSCSTGLGSESCTDTNTYVGDGNMITMDMSTGIGSINVERVPAS